jgi:hypothetical protein
MANSTLGSFIEFICVSLMAVANILLNLYELSPDTLVDEICQSLPSDIYKCS